MNSKKKGSRGERDCRNVWRKHGYEEAHRSQQFSGRGESAADIEGVDPRLHIEVKSGYSYKTVYAFLEQAIRDAKEGQIPIVNCKMDRKEWLCVMRLDDFIDIWKDQDGVPLIGNLEVVVLCKDCRHYDRITDGFGVCYKRQTVLTTQRDDDFCSYGERREDEHKV